MKFIVIVIYLCFWLVACGTDTSSGEQVSAAGSGNSSSSSATSPENLDVVISNAIAAQSSDQSEFSLRVTDAPLDDVVKVVLTFTAIELITSNGSDSVIFTYDTPQVIDLLELQGVKTASLLSSVPVPVGEYKEIRLFVDDSSMANFVELSGGGTHDLSIPGGSSSGLKLKGDISILSSQNSIYIIDFDLRQSIVVAGNSGKYILKPVLRLAMEGEVGHVRGTVSPSLLVDENCSDTNVDTFNSLYVYEGHDITPVDINQSSNNPDMPISTSIIKYDSESDSYFYEAAFLPAGNYTIALTCNSDAEDLNRDDDLNFFNMSNVVVLINNTTFL